jgi:hypothetical protein
MSGRPGRDRVRQVWSPGNHTLTWDTVQVAFAAALYWGQNMVSEVAVGSLLEPRNSAHGSNRKVDC